MDHHALNSPLSSNERRLRYTATLPTIADTFLAVACHLFAVSSAAANINHAVPAMHTVNMCKAAQPLIAAKLKAIRQLTANNEQASAHGENGLNQIAATVIDARLNQPR